MNMHRLQPWLVFIILFLSTSGIWAQQDVRKWEPDIRQFERLDATETYDPHAVMFVGSSSIRLWKTIAEDMKPYPVIQRGISGTTLTDINYYLNRIITPKHQFDAVVVYVGNDIHGGKTDKTPKEVLKLFQQTVKIIRRDHKTEPIFFVEIYPTPKRWAVWNNQKEANARIKKYCRKKKNLEFIDLADYCMDNFKQPRKEIYQNDGLHFNQAGYAIWNQQIKASLDKVLNKK